MSRIDVVIKDSRQNTDEQNAQILKFICGYMKGNSESKGRQPNGYVAFIEGMESANIEYGKES